MVMNEKEIIKLSIDSLNQLGHDKYIHVHRHFWPEEIKGARKHHDNLLENIKDDGYLAMLRHYGKMDKYECIAFCWLVSCWLIALFMVGNWLSGVAENYLINQREICEVLEN